MTQATKLTRKLLLYGALGVTLLAVWFAPEEAQEDSSVVASSARRAPSEAKGGASADLNAPAATTAQSEAQRQEQDFATALERQRALATLDLDLVRQRGGEGVANDAFASRSWYVPPPPKPAPPPVIYIEPPLPIYVPQAPPLPFTHLGRMLESGRSEPVHYLMDGERMLIVSAGDVIGGKYRFVGQIGNQLQFIYLPLDVRQNLPMSGAP